MKITIIAIPSFILIFLAVMSLPAQATETLSCASDAYEIQIHVNSENTVADLILYAEKTHVFRKEDLDSVTLKWVKFVPPFDGNILSVERKQGSSAYPAFAIEAKGVQGRLKIGVNEYRLECDWSR